MELRKRTPLPQRWAESVLRFRWVILLAVGLCTGIAFLTGLFSVDGIFNGLRSAAKGSNMLLIAYPVLLEWLQSYLGAFADEGEYATPFLLFSPLILLMALRIFHFGWNGLLLPFAAFWMFLFLFPSMEGVWDLSGRIVLLVAAILILLSIRGRRARFIGGTPLFLLFILGGTGLLHLMEWSGIRLQMGAFFWLSLALSLLIGDAWLLLLNTGRAVHQGRKKSGAIVQAQSLLLPGLMWSYLFPVLPLIFFLLPGQNLPHEQGAFFAGAMLLNLFFLIFLFPALLSVFPFDRIQASKEGS